MAHQTTAPARESARDFIMRIADPGRRRDCLALMTLMREATGAKAALWGRGMIGFGKFHYRSRSCREGEWFLVGFSPGTTHLTIYFMDWLDQHKTLLRALGTFKAARSCIHVKRLADIHLPTLRTLVRRTSRNVAERYR